MRQSGLDFVEYSLMFNFVSFFNPFYALWTQINNIIN